MECDECGRGADFLIPVKVDGDYDWDKKEYPVVEKSMCVLCFKEQLNLSIS